VPDQNPGSVPIYGWCPNCATPRFVFAAGPADARGSRYVLRCATCPAQEEYLPPAEVRARWREQGLDSQVAWFRRHNPLAGERRARTLDPAQYLLETFDGDNWCPVAVAADDAALRYWFQEPWQHPDRVN
jgi:hypothetical protein